MPTPLDRLRSEMPAVATHRLFNFAATAPMPAPSAEVMAELAATTPALIDELATLYARNFTESDVDAMLRFWRSTTGRKLAEIADRSQRLVKDFVDRQAREVDGEYNVLDPGVVGRTFGELAAKMMADPARVVEALAECLELRP